MITPLLELQPPVGFESIDVNVSSNCGSIAVMQAADCPCGSQYYFHRWGPNVFDRLLKQTSDAALEKYNDSDHLILEALVYEWDNVLIKHFYDGLAATDSAISDPAIDGSPGTPIVANFNECNG